MSFIKKDIFDLKKYLISQGIQPSDSMTAAIAEWDGLYKNKSKLSLPAAISSETARLVTMEMKSEITGGMRADFLNSQYKNVFRDIRKAVEFACAKGGIVFKPYVSGKKIKVGIIQAENFIPIEFSDSGEIFGAAFLDRITEESRVYTRIERHSFQDGIYKICNSAFVSQNGADLGKNISLGEIDAWKNIEPCVAMRNIEKPLFSYFKMPMANSIDSASPLGVSVFSNGISLIQDAEEQYSRLLWEFESGERALYVDEAAIRRDRNGNHILPDKRLYRLLNSGDDTLFQDWTPEIREQPLLNGMNEILRRLEFNVGLAYGTLSDVQDTDKTAEEIRASKQRSYSQVCDIQNSLKDALTNLAAAMDELCDLYALCPCGDYGISFEFDDSIAADRKTEFEEKLRLLEKGIMQPWEMRMWYFGEDENAAKKAAGCGLDAHNNQAEG